MSALCAVGNDTWYSRATSDTASVALRDRPRHPLPQPLGDRAGGRTVAQVWVNVFRDATARDRPADAVPPQLDRLTNADRSVTAIPAAMGSGVGFSLVGTYAADTRPAGAITARLIPD
jgi:hypothetical protein